MGSRMTVDEARAVWDPLVVAPEGYLDAQARIERERGLTDRERVAADVLYGEFVAALSAMGKAFGRSREADNAG